MQCVIEVTAYLTRSYELSYNKRSKKPLKGVKQKKILSVTNVILFINLDIYVTSSKF